MSIDEPLDSGNRFGRREFLVAGAGAGFALASAGSLNYGAIARAARTPVARGGSFKWGVASGMPSANDAVLWTRLGGISRSSKLKVEVATDKHFSKVVTSKDVVASKDGDFTVHTHVGGLKPYSEYFYRFETKDKHSRVGKFRTLPAADSNQKLKIGFYSCSSYEAGYFNAQGGLANEDVDLVLCLGDYIYEHHYYDGPRKDKTGKNKDGDVQSLNEFRQKYRFYQEDPALQDMHASHSFFSIWDDHEVEDNYAGHGPDSAQDPSDTDTERNTHRSDSDYPRRVPFRKRQMNGYRAFFEAMPRKRDPKHKNRIYGSVRIGKLAELYLTDERQYRDPQPCNDVQVSGCPADDDPGRTYLGKGQKRWLKKAVPASKAKWNLLASETMMMALATAPGVHANHDQWDGYGAERKEILESFLAKNVKNLVVLSGDIHTFIAGDLYTNGETTGEKVGVELVGGSATSLGLSEETGIPVSTLETIRQAADPHTIYADFEHRGYCVVDVSKDELTGTFKQVDALHKNKKPKTLAKFAVESGDPTLNQVS
jgi:alkaline phosphatase D